jgi:hypothetical protein
VKERGKKRERKEEKVVLARALGNGIRSSETDYIFTGD